ncbi:TetR/AcrR family transcriptional regulator [Oceanobacillus saliphilus]|uniref:TetR/AcrR family transcriptional regulator n=1 Tax=Oceanobacillus saliphilus TaxID=2925834 RepID=UPI00201DEABF|nr:TetR/AcrR family transcriptional regulator [Oceanobacillus saliphilus]
MKKNTKEEIVDSAVLLFNTYGTSSVSTNHIAEESGVSIGNLYYYFKNKEEIIREILECMISDWDHIWVAPSNGDILDGLQTIIRQSFHLEWKYRFFYRELIALMRIDEQLQQRHQEIEKQRIEEQKKLIENLINSGVIRNLRSPSDIDSLLTISWLISNYWLSFLESDGQEITDEQVERGVQLILTVFKPYLAI